MGGVLLAGRYPSKQNSSGLEYGSSLILIWRLTGRSYPQSLLAMRKLIVLCLTLLPLVLHGETPKMPKDKELKALVLDSLVAFNKAVQEKNFARFHQERLSTEMQKQYPLEKFTENFQVFIDKGYDISNIAEADPVFDTPPAVDSDGVLLLQGYYPTKPNKVTFRLKFINESSAWKIIGINVEAAPVVENTGTLPTNKEVKKLTLVSLLLFNDAIQAESFDDFYEQIAKIWQRETSPQKLLEAFQSFVDQNVDISPITTLEPTFDDKPAINQDGYLVVQGSYPMKPSKVSFALKYLNEDGNWKLVSINLHVKPSEEKGGKKAKKDASEEDNE